MPIDYERRSQEEQKLRRMIPDPVPDFLKRQAKEKQIYIFNTYPQTWRIDGVVGMGSVTIPACEEGKPYSRPVIVDGLLFDYFHASRLNEMNYRQVDGMDVAKQIVGIGYPSAINSINGNDRSRWGVLIAAGEVPTREELAEAKRKLTETMVSILQDGDRLAAQGPAGIATLDTQHRRAAAFLKQHREWAKLPGEQAICVGCGEFVQPQVAKCKFCGAILDWDKALQHGLVTRDAYDEHERAMKPEKAGARK